MGRLFSVLVVLFSLSNAWAQTDEQKEIWIKTGYGLDALYIEKDFQASNCFTSPKLFAACLVTLDFLLKQDKENPQELVWDSKSQSFLIQEAQLQLNLEFEQYMLAQRTQREAWEQTFQFVELKQIKTLFMTVKELLETHIEPDRLPYIAGTAYAEFLRSAYDPRNHFMPESEMRPKPNKYFGIGAQTMQIKTDGDLKGAVTLDPMAGSPAMAAGIKKGDTIVSVDGKNIQDLGLNDIVGRIKGPVDTNVEVGVVSLCSNSIKTVQITRGPIRHMPYWVKDSHFVSLAAPLTADPIETICSEEANEQQLLAGKPQALYVPLTSFMESHGQSLCDEFLELQLRDLYNPDSVGMIIDLRGNGGGSLDAVACMLDSVISSSAPLVGQVDVMDGVVVGTEPHITHRFHKIGPISSSVTYTDQVTGEKRTELVQLTYNKEIVVLVDGDSASASEIFAGTIQEQKRGWIIGGRTVGKGSVQTLRPHKNSIAQSRSTGESLTIGRTTAIYTLGSGRSPQQVGVIPDFMYDILGEPLVQGKDYLTREEQTLGSISYPKSEWNQPRPMEVANMEGCALAEGSHSDYFKNRAKIDERYKRPFVADYQLSLAKDILMCSPKKMATLYSQ